MDEPLLNDRIPPLSKKKCALIIIFFTASLLIITFVKLYLIEESIPPNIPQHNDTWDYLLFTQQWPISFCNDWIEKKEKSPDACVFSQNKYAWTVHGIWPSESNSSSYPEFCRRIPFNESDLTSIEDELIEHWSTTQKTANGSVSFWRHEWLKHGTCAVQIPQLDTELKYFTQGLEWNKHFNLTEALISCSIYPSDSKPYNVSEVEQCFKQTYDLIPQLYCVPNDVFGEDILLEIRLCVGKDLSFTSCDEFGANTICKDEFIYPATVSKKPSFAT